MSLADIYGECRNCGSDDLINNGTSIECVQCGSILVNLEPQEQEESDTVYECDECQSHNVEVITTTYECNDCGEYFDVDGDVEADVEIECSECESNDTYIVHRTCRCRSCGQGFVEQVL